MDMASRDEWHTYPENFVIHELLNSSKEFAVFYQAERAKIIDSLLWAEDTSLPDGIDFRSTRRINGVNIIRLRRVPATLQDAFQIAHELEHIVLDVEGYPILGAMPQFETLASSITCMVADLIVDSRLAKYGFNLRASHDRQIAESMRQLVVAQQPVSRVGELQWIFNYVGHLLEWELVADSDRKDDFQAWFDGRYPRIAQRGQKLLSRIKRIGYDTPEKQTMLFREIIRRYSLERMLTF